MEIRAYILDEILRKAWLVALLSVFLLFYGQADTVQLLKDVQVQRQAAVQGVTIDRHHGVRIDARSLSRGIHSLGEADIIHSLSMIPGYSSVSDYSGGISIDGADNQHTSYVLDGARVFFPFHFGGIFSGFNTNHISSSVIGGIPSLSAPKVLGTAVTVNTPMATVDSVGTTAHMGLLSSNLSIRLPIGSRTRLFVSGRLSYINALYGSLINDENNKTRYGFGDANITLVSDITDVDRLKFNFFANSDYVDYKGSGSAFITQLRWHNAVGSVLWHHNTSSMSMSHALSVSSLWSKIDLKMEPISLQMPSSVMQTSLSGDFSFIDKSIELGYRVEHSLFHPQRVDITDKDAIKSPSYRLSSWSLSPSVRYILDIGEHRHLYATVNTSAYFAGDYRRFIVDPALCYEIDNSTDLVTLTASTSSQQMHCVGFTDLGMASDYWLPATDKLPIQRAMGVDVVWNHRFMPRLSIVAKSFFRSIRHTHEYTASVIDLIESDYDPLQHIVQGRGYNVGGDVMLQYDNGTWSARGGYAIAVCRRIFDDEPNTWVPAATEPLHSLKALVQWHPSAQLHLSAHFVLASGRRYTPIRAIYFIGGNILSEYGKRNSAHLSAYHRLDLSASYNLRPITIGRRSIESFLNFSIINAYGHDNIEMQYFVYDNDNRTISLRRVASLYSLLPSLSYTVMF